MAKTWIVRLRHHEDILVEGDYLKFVAGNPGQFYLFKGTRKTLVFAATTEDVVCIAEYQPNSGGRRKEK